MFGLTGPTAGFISSTTHRPQRVPSLRRCRSCQILRQVFQFVVRVRLRSRPSPRYRTPLHPASTCQLSLLTVRLLVDHLMPWRNLCLSPCMACPGRARSPSLRMRPWRPRKFARLDTSDNARNKSIVKSGAAVDLKRHQDFRPWAVLPHCRV